MFNPLLAEELMRERHAQREREVERDRLVREAARASQGRRVRPGAGLYRAAAARAALVGGWLVRTGIWLQSMAPVPLCAETSH